MECTDQNYVGLLPYIRTNAVKLAVPAPEVLHFRMNTTNCKEKWWVVIALAENDLGKKIDLQKVQCAVRVVFSGLADQETPTADIVEADVATVEQHVSWYPSGPKTEEDRRLSVAQHILALYRTYGLVVPFEVLNTQTLILATVAGLLSSGEDQKQIAEQEKIYAVEKMRLERSLWLYRKVGNGRKACNELELSKDGVQQLASKFG